MSCQHYNDVVVENPDGSITRTCPDCKREVTEPAGPVTIIGGTVSLTFASRPLKSEVMDDMTNGAIKHFEFQYANFVKEAVTKAESTIKEELRKVIEELMGTKFTYYELKVSSAANRDEVPNDYRIYVSLVVPYHIWEALTRKTEYQLKQKVKDRLSDIVKDEKAVRNNKNLKLGKIATTLQGEAKKRFPELPVDLGLEVSALV